MADQEEDERMDEDDEPLEEDEDDEEVEPPVPFPIKNYNSASLSALFPPTINPECDPPVVQSLEFHREGKFLVSVDSFSDLLQIDIVSGEVVKKISCKKYPVGLCRYTHHSQAVLCSSRKSDGNESDNNDESGDHDIRYLSLYDNTYQRFFHGHTDEVVSLAMNPCDDTFASASKDKTVRLWKLNSSKCHAILTIPSNSTSAPCVAYDPTGKVFAVTYSTGSANVVKLFDAQNYSTGAFATFSLEHSDIAKYVSSPELEAMSRCAWTNIVFSPDEAYILVSTKGQGLIFILDAFDGNLLKCFSQSVQPEEGGENLDSSVSTFGSQACFTPDGAHVLAGTDSGKICFWSMASPNQEETKSPVEPSYVLEAGHPSQIDRVACSPTFGVIASSCSVVALWTDTENHKADEVVDHDEL